MAINWKTVAYVLFGLWMIAFGGIMAAHLSFDAITLVMGVVAMFIGFLFLLFVR